MSVGVRTFDNFKDANAYAKSIVLSVGKSPLVRTQGKKYEVIGEGVTPFVTAPPVNTSAAKEAFEKIRIQLEDQSTSEIEIKNAIGEFLKVFPNLSAEKLGINSDLVLLEKLEDIHLALEEYEDLIIDSAHPRSQNRALHFANRFSAISELLSPYPISKRVGTKSRELTEKSVKLPHIADNHSLWLHKVSILNQSGPICRHCNHLARMHIVGEKGSELWRCFENYHGTRFLNREQRNFLDV